MDITNILSKKPIINNSNEGKINNKVTEQFLLDRLPMDQENLDLDNLKDNFNKHCSKHGYTHKLPHVVSAKKFKRIIVIGDLHGDVPKTLKSLLVAGVINRAGQWIGGKTAVVQIGDQLDGCRPAHDGDNCSKDEKDYADIRVMDVLDRFHAKAVKKGGAIYSLIGNHEVMQDDDNRCISPKSYAYFNNYTDPKTGKTFRSGKAARKHAFQPGNEYAIRLACTRQAAIIIGSFIFVHAGILPELAKNMDVKEINLVVRKWLLGKISGDDEIKGVGRVKDLITNYNISPFWPRFFGQLKTNMPMSNHTCKTKLKPTLDIYQVNGMVVGHTPQFMYGQGINSTCDRKLWRVDVGMSSAFTKFTKGKAKRTRKVQVLEIKNDGRDPKKDFNILAEL